MNRIGTAHIGVALVFAIFASTALGQATPASPSGAPLPAAPPNATGLDLSAIDRSADPCNDFYQYACGKWIKDNPVPAGQVRWVRSLWLLRERQLYEVWHELDRAATKPASPLERKYGDFFAACMDEEELQKKGLQPVKPALDRIAALTDSKGIASLMGELAAAGEPAGLFALDVEPDPKGSKKLILSLSRAGLPPVGHPVRMFLQTGDTIKQAMSEEAAVVGVVKALGRSSTNDADSDDPDQRYHVFSLAELEKLAPHFDFRGYFNHLTTRPIEMVNVTDPDYLQAVDELLGSLPIDSWRSYFRWQVVSGQAVALPKEIRFEDHAFRDAEGNLQESTARWRQCTAITDEVFGDALIEEWARRNLRPADQAGSGRLVQSLEKALGEEIRTLPWMSEETKRIAEGKLAALRTRIGHPEKGLDYSALKIDRHDFLADLHRSELLERNQRLSKLGTALDPKKWDIDATMLQARYVRSTNSLYISAGLIQAPLFEGGADPAVNFGEMGVSAAHELTHGFDAVGSRYGPRGEVHDWWSPSDRKQFDEATSCDATQVNESVPASDVVPLSGAAPQLLPVAETTADNGGLRIAYRALMDALAAQGGPDGNPIEGYSERQRFFLSFAQASCEGENVTPARGGKRAHPRSVGQERVNGALQNFEEFGVAFQCAKGKPMYPEKSCRVW
jgi:putative endopeptidase